MSDQLIPAQILHVDDDPDALNDVRDFLEDEEIPDWGRPKVTSIESFDDALSTLEAHRFDLMILDVRLGAYEDQDIAPEEEEGARTLQRIKECRFLPVIFWTGLPSKVEHLRTPLVHVLERTKGLDTLIASVRDLFATSLPAVNRALRHLVEDEQRRYMWEFVAAHWDELRPGWDEMALAYLMARRLGRSLSGPGIQRLAAELGGGAAGAPAPGTIHAAEMYIVPPLQDTKPEVGDLYRETLEDGEDRWWLVVTPSCDLEWGKADYVVLATCTPVGDDPRVVDWRDTDNGENRRRVRELVSQSTGGQQDRYLFLPAAPTIPDLVTDFQRIRSITIHELDAMERIASLVSPFAEAAVSRFTRYFGRVGTDDLDVGAIMARLHAAPPDGPEDGAAA